MNVTKKPDSFQDIHDAIQDNIFHGLDRIALNSIKTSLTPRVLEYIKYDDFYEAIKNNNIKSMQFMLLK